jgi:hypothetical protein
MPQEEEESGLGIQGLRIQKSGGGGSIFLPQSLRASASTFGPGVASAHSRFYSAFGAQIAVERC